MVPFVNKTDLMGKRGDLIPCNYEINAKKMSCKAKLVL